jgi:hypothetical protein
MTIEEREQEEIKKKQRIRSSSKKRYGYVVNQDGYQTSSIVTIICGVLAIIIIPLELFLERLLTKLELPMIASL